MPDSVYIHIPFCEHICHYCDFTKFFYKENQTDAYLEALANEIGINVAEPKKYVKTIYIGGGTPTVLTLAQLEKLMSMINEAFDVTHAEEFTIEANPGDIDTEKIKLLKEWGVNRVSLGVQVFDNDMLKELGRAHKVKDVYTTVSRLQQNGIENISIDLIYALPNQTPNHFRKTVEEAVAFDLPHYSTYSLQIEPKTVFYQRHKKGILNKPPEEEEVEMFHILKDTMAQNRLNRYEVSNFSKPGFESKHNLTYWNNDYYYGFGAGASGYLPGRRTNNLKPLPAYIKQANLDGKPLLQAEEIGLKEAVEEEFFLGLRKMEGVNKAQFKERYGFSHDLVYSNAIDVLKQKGWLAEDEAWIRLTEEGLLFGNSVFAHFLIEEADLKHVR
ncbi:Anaerobilin synthase [Lentibacillus sp. JNUCC-1]|uniref:radical SAM family heme chaperone HemW n=1 Tax=Lentibacillus sp. JNUCC-1 TaxID=2654513 RepID=UPI0012E7F5FC|nr:radical SAM family heme chaperone HemW [Lentibacillus sp. JNUCC-1]MUV39583.1 Anaerobilin synthase [Lentibacillus sp. JNUCC-1]